MESRESAYSKQKHEHNILVKVAIICFELRSERCGSRSIHIGPVEIIRTKEPRSFRSLRSKFYELLRQIAFRAPIGWILLDDIDPEDEAKLDFIIQELELVKKIVGIKSRKKVDFPRAVYKVKAFLPAYLIHEWLEANIENIRRKIKELKSRRRIKRWTDMLKRLEQYKRKLLGHVA